MTDDERGPNDAASRDGARPNEEPRLQIRLDRDLPVSVALQVQGQIEYGVIAGHVAPGTALPSVRDLAAELGASPATISAAYRALQEKGVIRTVPGRATYVREDVSAERIERSTGRLDRAVVALVLRAEREGRSRTDLMRVVHDVSLQHPESGPSVRIVLVGVFRHATEAYAARLRTLLRPRDPLDVTTYGAVRDDADAREVVEAADLILTFAHRATELEPYASERRPIAVLRLVPSRETRVRLAELDPTASLLLVSAVPEFLPILRRAAAAYAGHVRSIRGVVYGSGSWDEAMSDVDVVVYGTGSEDVVGRLPAHVTAFEYRYEPDPVQVERTVRPTIEAIRGRTADGT